jgi:hypothetical protein
MTLDLMKAALPDADVQNYERHISGLSLPDPDDRHVLAAAIEAPARPCDVERKTFPRCSTICIRHFRMRC